METDFQDSTECTPEPSGSPLLDPSPKSEFEPHDVRAEKGHLFHLYATERKRWTAVLDKAPLKANHPSRFQRCGENAWIEHSPSTGRVRIASHQCKLRICPRCRNIAAKRIKKQLEKRLEGKARSGWKLLTLTMRASDRPLKEQIRWLYSCFKKLRKTQEWKSYVHGGYAVLETNYNADVEMWHPHLHIVMDSGYFPRDELIRLWKRITRGSFIIDIRPLKNVQGALEYLTKYLSKPTKGLTDAADEVLIEYYHAIAGQHFMVTFGIAPKAHAKLPKDVYPRDWCGIVRLSEFMLALREEKLWALTIQRGLWGQEMVVVNPLKADKPPPPTPPPDYDTLPLEYSDAPARWHD